MIATGEMIGGAQSSASVARRLISTRWTNTGAYATKAAAITYGRKPLRAPDPLNAICAPALRECVDCVDAELRAGLHVNGDLTQAWATIAQAPHFVCCEIAMHATCVNAIAYIYAGSSGIRR